MYRMARLSRIGGLACLTHTTRFVNMPGIKVIKPLLEFNKVIPLCVLKLLVRKALICVLTDNQYYLPIFKHNNVIHTVSNVVS